MSYIPLREIIETFEFNDAERALVEQWGDAAHAAVIASQILAAKKYERAIEKLIASNEQVSRSNEKYSKATIFLTMTIILITMTGIDIEFDKFKMEITTQLIEDNAEAKLFIAKEMKKRVMEIMAITIVLGAIIIYFFTKHWPKK